MSETLETLGIDRMTVLQRLRLVEAIWDSIPDAPDELAIPDWQREELARRVAAADADPAGGMSWEEFKERLGRKT